MDAAYWGAFLGDVLGVALAVIVGLPVALWLCRRLGL